MAGLTPCDASGLTPRIGESITDTVEKLMDRPPRHFAEFAREHAARFVAIEAGVPM